MYLCLYYTVCGFKISRLYPATDLLLEELALNSASSETVSESNDTADGEVKTKLQNLHCTIYTVPYLSEALLLSVLVIPEVSILNQPGDKLTFAFTNLTKMLFSANQIMTLILSSST